MNLRFLPKNFEPLTLSVPGNNEEKENDVNEEESLEGTIIFCYLRDAHYFLNTTLDSVAI